MKEKTIAVFVFKVGGIFRYTLPKDGIVAEPFEDTELIDKIIEMSNPDINAENFEIDVSDTPFNDSRLFLSRDDDATPSDDAVQYIIRGVKGNIPNILLDGYNEPPRVLHLRVVNVSEFQGTFLGLIRNYYQKALKADFDNCEKCHDWKNYATEDTITVWDTLPIESRCALVQCLEAVADKEEWD